MERNLFGRAIKQARIERHLTQDKLAGKCGITQSRLSRIERGHDLPPVGLAQRLMENLNMPELRAKYCLSCPIAKIGFGMLPEPSHAAMLWMTEKLNIDLKELEKSVNEYDTKAFTQRSYELLCAINTLLGGLIKKNEEKKGRDK